MGQFVHGDVWPLDSTTVTPPAQWVGQRMAWEPVLTGFFPQGCTKASFTPKVLPYKLLDHTPLPFPCTPREGPRIGPCAFMSVQTPRSNTGAACFSGL